MGPSRVAVVGAGAIGGTIAAWLSRKGDDVDLTVCVRTPFERLVVDVPGGETIDVAPRVLVDPAAATPVDWVLVATKTYDEPSAWAWVDALVGPSTKLVVLQNGVEHAARFLGAVPRARMLPVVIEMSAERAAPGRIRQRSAGRLVVPDGDVGVAFAALIEGTPIEIATTDDFTTAAWRKLVLNAAGVVQPLTGLSAAVVRRPRIAALARDIAAEAVAVGRAAGARLDPDLPDQVVDRLKASAPDSINSMLADRLARRPMEIDARNGVVVRLGATHGVPTPLNAMAVALLETDTRPS